MLAPGVESLALFFFSIFSLAGFRDGRFKGEGRFDYDSIALCQQHGGEGGLQGIPLLVAPKDGI